jgi:hypothetical protein
MTDLTDFMNVVASAEDWAGFGADGREPEEPIKRFTIDVPADFIAGSGPLAPDAG